jgi:gamma-glutamyltranspeptidase/glutathione hydrolase
MLETPVFARAAVAAPHRLASETGKAMLAEGANAIEAMVAMAATIAVVYPHMNGIGGDAFWLIAEPSGRVQGINAAGRSGRKATLRRYLDRGLEAIPARGPDAILTVPGAIAGWGAALELARAADGRLPLRTLLEDAIRHAGEGYAISASEARNAPKEADALLSASGFRETFLDADGRAIAGAPRRQPALAQTLSHLAHAGLEDFYRGDVGREIAADLDRLDTAVTREDLADCRAAPATPLRLDLPGVSLFNLPPPTQGVASLMMLGVFGLLGVREVDGFAHMHGLIEAAKRAYLHRDRIVTDPGRTPSDPAALLTPDALRREAGAIDMGRAASAPRLRSDEGDTIYMAAIDGEGRAVSMIQSIYWEYGSGVVLPRTGVLMQNRGLAFSLDPSNLNALSPGLQPFHTLNPAFARFSDGRIMPYGTMGGDGQPQIQAQIFTRMRMGLPLAEALDRPRFLFGRTWGAASARVRCEARLDDAVARRLGQVGHEVEVDSQPYADGFGHAAMVLRRTDGAIEAAADPRSDGSAAGI